MSKILNFTSHFVIFFAFPKVNKKTLKLIIIYSTSLKFISYLQFVMAFSGGDSGIRYTSIIFHKVPSEYQDSVWYTRVVNCMFNFSRSQAWPSEMMSNENQSKWSKNALGEAEFVSTINAISTIIFRTFKFDWMWFFPFFSVWNFFPACPYCVPFSRHFPHFCFHWGCGYQKKLPHSWSLLCQPQYETLCAIWYYY